MKAIQITEFGGPDVMHLVDLDAPTPGAGQELITVSAIGINYADTHQTENSYLSPQKLPLIPGIEVVGTTTAGVRVLAPVDGGGYAQQAVTHSATMIPIAETVISSCPGPGVGLSTSTRCMTSGPPNSVI
jgi:NADPH2:quinone reductase